MSGGGSGGGSTNTVQNSNSFIPGWLSNAGQAAVNSAAMLSSQPYQPYTGQTVAPPSAMTEQAYQQIGNLYSNAQNLMGGAYGGAQNLLGGSYQQANALYNPYMQGAGAQQIGANAQSLMSPYTSSVIDPAMALGQQTLAQNLQQVGAQANQAGAFGGSRQGVMEGVAQSQSALQQAQLAGNLLNTGWNAALAPATTAEAQGYGGAQALANMGQSNAQALANLGVNQANALQNVYGQQNTALLGAGQQQQQFQQNLLNAGYGQYLAQQAWPYQQLQTYLSAISGIPYSTTNQAQTQEMMPSNLLGQAIGGVTALGGLAGGVGSILNNQGGTG